MRRVKEILALLVVAFAPAACMYNHRERMYICTVDSRQMCIKLGCSDVKQAVKDHPEKRRKYVCPASSHVNDDVPKTTNKRTKKKQVRKK